MGTVLRTSPINLWLIGITFLVLFSEQWPRAVATATSGSRIISESLNLGLNAPKLDERSLRNRNEKELAALHQPLIQPAQAGGGTPHVSITPPFLEFGARPICIPVVHTIEVINTSEEKELTLFSITTDSAHYHPPIFKQTVLAPLGKTMIAVIFVPRVLGRLDGKLVIKTSLGGFLYQAHGEGLPNPYKVFPLVSAKVPVGVPYSPSMKLFNPFDEPLHVKEVYTSEGFLHLELPKVQNEEEAGQAGMWELMPQQHKTVIHLNFKSQSAGKFQGFVHMKTDKDNLVIPVEIVATKGGVHRTPEELDFGTLTTPSERKTLTLSLHNSGTVPLRCTDMYMLSPDSHLLVDFKKYTILAPGQETVLARVTYRGHTEGQFSGKLLVRLNNTNLANSRVEIPYRARVLHGSLGYSQANTTFPVGPYPFEPVTKELYITNKFPLALVILAASVSDRNFTLLGFEPQVVIRPGHTMKVLSIQFLASSPDMLHHSALSLVTNASTLQIPLQCYHGRLLFSVPDLSNTQSKASEQKVVDFGVFGVHDERVKLFNLTNLNPMKISLQYRPSEQAAAGDSSKLSLWPRGVWNTQHKHTPHPHASSWSTSDDPVIELEPGHSALFSIKVSSVREENVSSIISFSTQHENFTVAVKYQSVNASVQFSPQPIRFEQSFPGAKLTHSLMARSTCDRPLTIVSIASSDPRMVPVLTKQVLEPNQLMQVGHLVFNPSKAPSERNYMQLLPGHWKDEEEISLAGEPLSHEDLEAWSARDDLWNEMRTIGSQKIHATIVVDTDVVMGSRLTVHGGLFKPTVVAVEHAESSFGLTQVGAVAEKFVHVHNPADVAVHMKLAQVRPNSSLANSSMSSHIGLIAPRMLYSNDFELSAAAMEGLLIPPHSKSKLGPIFFKPSSLTSVNATLFVKNNLTILDPIIMHGEGGSGFFHFKDGLNLLDTLKIELNESDFRVHLDKHKAAQGTNTQPSPVFFQRSFRATNNGNLPIEVLGIEVNGRGCVAYGFEIFNCSSFTLQPDESTSIVLSFQPDYSASVIRRELFVTTTLGIQRVPVEVTLPHELLPELAAVLSPGDSFSGMRQLCLIAAAVALVLISHLSLSDLLTSSSDVAAVPVKIGVFLADTPDVPPAVDKQDPPQVSINKDDKAPVPQPQPESNAAPAEASTAQKLPKVKKALPVENKPKPNKEEPPAREPVAAQSEEVVKPKSKKEKDREKAERDKAERDRRELERAEKAWAEAEAKKLLKQEAQAKREKEAALRREAQLEAQRAQLEAQREAKTKREAEWKVESKRKKDARDKAEVVPALPQPKLPTPRASVETDTRPLDKRSQSMGSVSTAQVKAQQKAQPVPVQENIWGMREKAALSLLAESNDKVVDAVPKKPAARGDGFSSAIGGHMMNRANSAPGRAAAAPMQAPMQAQGVFSSAIGGDPIGGDAIWHRTGPSMGATPFSNHSISPSAQPTAPAMDPSNLALPARSDPFPTAIGKQPGAAFFNFPAAPPTHTSSLFSMNPFFDPTLPPADSPGLSAAITGDLLDDEADASNDDTFGPASLSPHSSPIQRGTYGPQAGANSPFPSFSDLNNDSAPFVPAGAQQSQSQWFRGQQPQQPQPPLQQSRFGFPPGLSPAKGEEGDSNFSLFG